MLVELYNMLLLFFAADYYYLNNHERKNLSQREVSSITYQLINYLLILRKFI